MSDESTSAYLFVYDSLLLPGTLKGALPFAEPQSLFPAKVAGYFRLWNVAFPNDSTQKDRAYYDEEEERPPVVLLANLARETGTRSKSAANGILVPVSAADLERLRRRKLRYRELDVSARIQPYAGFEGGWEQGRSRAFAFVGRADFTRSEIVKRGVIQRSYLDEVLRGVSVWERRFPGFEADFHASTVIPPQNRVVSLRCGGV